MARIIYGVQGNGRGHAIRALTIARRFPAHEFLFLTHTDGIPVLNRQYRTVKCPNPETPVRGHRVAGLDMAKSNLRFWARRNRILKSVVDLFEDFRPDVAVTDYEHFVPVAARKLGVPCLSIDHQHIVTSWNHEVPVSQVPSYVGAFVAARAFFSSASEYLVVSFFQPPRPRTDMPAKHVPPLLRDLVLERDKTEGEHVLAYQSTSTFGKFLPFLRSTGRPVIVYGLNSAGRDGNVIFREFSEEDFLTDLASCSYVICGGGHTLISEALHFGKPVISFPIGSIFEQFLNAHYLQKLGYGMCLMGFNPGEKVIRSFEKSLDRFRENIRRENFCGNEEIFGLVRHFIEHGDLAI